MTRITTRYVVRNRAGEELVVPSLSDLHSLYTHGFLSDDDLVRRERSQTWLRVGEMALEGGRGRAWDPRALLAVAGALIALALAVGLLLLR
jgi:hypothetical protein